MAGAINEAALDELGQRAAFLIKRSTQDRMEAGRLLCEAQAGLPHGAWYPWLAKHGIAPRTASRLMLEYRDPERAERNLARAEEIGHWADLDGSGSESVIPIRADTSGNDEWYTPAHYVELARVVMGGIDLDPASCERGQQNVQADRYYTKDDDGLLQPWRGRVWMNPPYSKGLIDSFVAKVVSEYEAGNISESIVLTSNFTDTEWFHRVWGAASCVCFTRGRIKFEGPDGVGNSPTNGHVFFYLGRNAERFREVFAEVGAVAQLTNGSKLIGAQVANDDVAAKHMGVA